MKLKKCSLARRIETEIQSTSYSLGEVPRLTPMVIPSARLSESASPLDELWAIKAATDMVSHDCVESQVCSRTDGSRASPLM